MPDNVGNKILVFPAATEIGKEVVRALAYQKDYWVYTATTISYPKLSLTERQQISYGLTYGVDRPDEMRNELLDLCFKKGINLIYPAHDEVGYLLSQDLRFKGRVIIPSREVTEICRFKSLTYKLFEGKPNVPVPKVFTDLEATRPSDYPIFVKPDNGQGSRGTYILGVKRLGDKSLAGMVYTEFLYGNEYTIDCFSSGGQLQFVGPRRRVETREGISKQTTNKIPDFVYNILVRMAAEIFAELALEGAWFFQAKFTHPDDGGELKLLEIAPRISGCSSYWRASGVNLPLLSLYGKQGYKENVKVMNQDLVREMIRPITTKYTMDVFFNEVWIDLDDTLILWRNKTVNAKLMAFIYQCRNQGKRVCLITKHNRRPSITLREFKISETIFDDIIHLAPHEKKSEFISIDSIFIDDSFQERQEVWKSKNIPVFAPSEVECLLK